MSEWLLETRGLSKRFKGVVAVDPKLIRLGSRLYIPGYGLAVAGDTGGRIIGRRIDLGYEENDLTMWYDWVDVYVLTPAPPRNLINFQLPDPPRTRAPYLP